MKKEISKEELLEFHNKETKNDTIQLIPRSFIPDDEILNNIFKYVNKDEILFICLCGSRSIKCNSPYSDVDVLIYTNNIEYTKEEHYINGTRYALNITNNEYIIPGGNATCYRYFLFAKPIYDPFDKANDFVKKIYKELDKCNSTTKKYDEKYKDNIRKQLEFIKGDNIINLLIKDDLLCSFPNHINYYNGLLSIGEKRTVDILLRNNPEIAGKYAVALCPNSSYESLLDLYDSSFKNPINFDYQNEDFSDSIKTFEYIVKDNNGNSYTLHDLIERKKKHRKYFLDLCAYFDVPIIKEEIFLDGCKKIVPLIYDYLMDLIV